MATQASLDGIAAYGHRWRFQVRVNLPDIPEAHDNCETNTDVILLAHRIAKGLHKDLGRTIRPLGEAECPESLTESIKGIRDGLDCYFILENPDSIQNLSDGDRADLSDGLIDELIFQINNIYDEFDYYRVLAINVQAINRS